MLRPFAPRRGRTLLLSLAILLPALAATGQAQETECDTPTDREVRSLRFEGNKTFTDAELSQRIATTASSLARRHLSGIRYLRLLGTKRCLDPDGLKPDVDRLKAFYRERGFYDTAVDTLVVAEAPDAVRVTFRINEGQAMRLERFVIEGLEAVKSRANIVENLNLKVGERFGQVLMTADEDLLVARLRNSGYPYAEVLANFTANRAEHHAEVVLSALPGPYTHFGVISVVSTPAPGRPKVQIPAPVVRHLLGFAPGDEYSDRAVTVGRRTLIQTGAFEHVDVTVVRDTSTVKTDSIVRVDVQLREGLMRQVDTEFGWATLDCFRASATYTDRNFASLAQRFEVTGRASKLGFGDPTDAKFTRENLCIRSYLDDDDIASSVVNYTLNATLRQPFVPGRPNAALSAYRERRGEYKAYLRTTFIGGEASLTQDLPAGTNVRGAYTLEYGKTEAEPALLCGVFLRCTPFEQDQVTAPLRFAVASVAFQRRSTDNLVDPRSGTIFRTEARGSSRFLLSDTSLTFLKGTADLAYYYPLAPRTVFAARLRLGAIGGGSTANGTKLPPPQERLYAGGAQSVRGYRQNELGDLVYVFTTAHVTQIDPDTRVYFVLPSDKSERVIPVGGNLLVVANADMRFRDPFFPNRLQYTLFTDVGAVWVRQAGNPGIGNHLKYTPGVGVRYFSDIGPIQVNVGYNPYDQPAGRAFFIPPDETGGFSQLFCVSNTPPLTAHRVPGTNQYVQDQADCQPNFQPERATGKTAFTRFFRRLTLTLSIGPDF